MAKKITHRGMSITDEEHAQWHKDNRKLTPAQHKALIKKMGISDEEDKKWHAAHGIPRPSLDEQGLRPVNPFAVGGGFLDYCVKQGWLVREGAGRNARYFATAKGGKALKKFGVNI